MLNPKLFQYEGEVHPMAEEDEVFVLVRKKINFEAVIPVQGKFKGKGKMYITTQRLIFCPELYQQQNGVEFQAFSIPLSSIVNEKFNQPIFGPSNLAGKATPPSAQDKEISWKFSFCQGGTGIVLRTFLDLMQKQRVDTDEIGLDFVEQARQAFVDPSDPSVIYVSQPHSF